MGKYGRWIMESLTMGSVIKGFTFKDRVYDIIDQFDFPEGVKDDAKRIAFDLSSEHTGRKTAVVCLYLSSQFNGFDFKERMDDVLEKYQYLRTKRGKIEPKNLKRTSNTKYWFLSEIKKISDKYNMEPKFEMLERMHNKLENTATFPESDLGTRTLCGPNGESQSGS